jgi:tRNA(adenine34) deaminase
MSQDQRLTDEKFMQLALKKARQAALLGEVPVGAVLVGPEGQILSQVGNKRETLNSTLGHAELMAIHRACQKLDSWRLIDCTLYVTLEPCFMCAGALVQSRIGRVVFGALDPKGGALLSLAQLGQDTRLNHQFEITAGVLAEECSQILKNFFKKKRQKTAANK